MRKRKEEREKNVKITREGKKRRWKIKKQKEYNKKKIEIEMNLRIQRFKDVRMRAWKE